MAEITGEQRELRFQQRAPSIFTHRVMAVVSAYGLCLAVPVVLAAIAMSLMPVGYLPLLLPFVAFAGTIFFLPIGLGNPYITKLVKGSVTGLTGAEGAVVVQITATPRLRRGVTGLLEDADDFGWLQLGREGLAFRGDAVEINLPWAEVNRIHYRNVGWRGLFFYGSVVVEIKQGRHFDELCFAERCSWTVPNSRAVTKKLLQAASEGWKAAQPAVG